MGFSYGGVVALKVRLTLRGRYPSRPVLGNVIRATDPAWLSGRPALVRQRPRSVAYVLVMPCTASNHRVGETLAPQRPSSGRQGWHVGK